MAIDSFIKLKGIDGESKDATHPKEIEVLSWSWGMASPGSFHAGGGGGTGKVDVRDFTFVKRTDRSTPVLMQFCAQFKHIDEALFTARKAGGSPLPYLTFKFTNVGVSAVDHGGSDGSGLPTESVTLNFAKVDATYQEQNDKGGKEGGEVLFAYDMRRGE